MMKVVETIRPLGISPFDHKFDIEWPTKGQIKKFLIQMIKAKKKKEKFNGQIQNYFENTKSSRRLSSRQRDKIDI